MYGIHLYVRKQVDAYKGDSDIRLLVEASMLAVQDGWVETCWLAEALGVGREREKGSF